MASKGVHGSPKGTLELVWVEQLVPLVWPQRLLIHPDGTINGEA